MSRLDTSDPAIKAALDKVTAGSSEEYAVLGYVPKTAKLKVVGEGSGWDDMCEEMNEGKVMYSYNRRVIGGKTKFVFVAWTGEGVDGVMKGQCATHVADLNAHLKKCGAAVHLQVNARSENDLVLATVEKQLAAAGGANYDAGAKKQGAESVHRDMRTLNQIHTQAQVEANKDRASGDIKGNVQVVDKSESDAYWSQTRQEQSAPEPRATSKPALDTAQRNQFWAEQRRKEEEDKARQAAERQAATQARQVNKGESDQYWQQQRSAPAPAAAAPRAPAPTGPAGGASSLRSKFESGATSTPTPAPSGPPKKAPPTFGAPPSAPGGARPAPPGAAPPGPPPVSKPAPAPPVSAPPPVVSAPPPPVKATPPPPVPPPAPVEPAAEEYQEEAYQEETYAEESYAEESYAEESYAEESYAEESYAEEAQPAQEEAYAEESYAEETYAEESYGEEAAAGGAYLGQVQATYDFPGENEGDLAFSAGDIINILEKDDSGWWRGELNGAVGVFPTTFVQEI
eukprot:TRINITY_DN9745_c0_g1_i1.p1 TRINITY_DN9745_c0_g1~~TRINITY_DN9745_c0_g1_i1.p1  ORF type:complete len:532 (+),score=164.33 TRINITY_DN9745_c0_g1_i1:59-1597(+)